MINFQKNIADILISGGVGVIPTDTIYGLVGRAEDKSVVDRINIIRKRSINKPYIVLISSFDDLKKFGVEISDEIKIFLEKNMIWPGKVSIVFTCLDLHFDYLTRTTKSIAFRMPDVAPLRELISQTGPLVAPSANVEGETPAKTIDEVKLYFGHSVDFYVDGGELNSLPSTLIKFDNGKAVVLREGAVKI